MRAFCVILTLAIASPALFSGCAKTDKDGEARPAKTGTVTNTHNKGDRGGKKFHLQEGGKSNHDYLCECVFKDGKLAIYIVDHGDTTKTVKADESEISIIGVKHDGEALPPIMLSAMEKDGENWFEASGDAIPEGVEDQHDLAGGTFSVTVGKKKLDGIFMKQPDKEHEKEKHEKEKKTDEKKTDKKKTEKTVEQKTEKKT